MLVPHVLAGTPAHRSGVNAGDEILALDSMRVNATLLTARLAGREPGERDSLAIFRRAELLTLEVELAPPSASPLRITQVAAPTELQEAIYRDWLRGEG